VLRRAQNQNDTQASKKPGYINVHPEKRSMRPRTLGTVGVIVAALVVIAASGSSHAVSFDCSKGSGIVEKLICRDPTLSQLDDRLSAAYSVAQAQSGNSPLLASEQRAWMARRNQCQTSACVSSAYTARTAELNGGSNAAPTTSGQPTQADNVPATTCDTAAAFPYDSSRQAQGVGYIALDSSVAIPQCTDAVARYPSSGRFYFQLGRALEKANRIADAITAYRRASDLGHGGGFNNLGELYRDGKGLPRDLNQAEQLFQQAAALEYPEAQFNLANMLLKTPRNDAIVEQARQLLSAAVAAGYVDAARSLQALGPSTAPVIARPRIGDQQAVQQRVAEEAHQRQLAEREATLQHAAEEARLRQLAEKQASQKQTTAEDDLKIAQAAYDNKDYQTALGIWQTLAERGNSAAQGGMARLYVLGQGVNKNDDDALRFARLAAQQGNAAGQNVLGILAKRGIMGVTKAGAGVLRDREEAIKYFRLSAEQGFAPAQYNLGAMYAEYRSDLGIVPNLNESFRLYRLAADQGFSPAQLAIGIMYFEGYRGPIDQNGAVNYIRKAADQGYAEAQATLGTMYLENAHLTGADTSKNLSEAVRYLKLAADQGVARAKTSLADAEQGQRLTEQQRAANEAHQVQLIETAKREFNLKQYGVAFRHFSEYAKSGNSEAQYYLGLMYLDGLGLPEADTSAAAGLFKSSSDQGFSAAQFRLGVMYLDGLGVPKDQIEAVHSLKLSVDQGNADAQVQLGFMYHSGKGVTQDYKEALSLYKIAAQQGDSRGQNNVGVMYLNGEGVEKSENEAVKWFTLAARAGNDTAKKTLDMIEQKQLIARLLESWPELAAASDYDVFIMARNTAAPNIVKRLGGGFTSTTGTAALCVGAFYPEEQAGTTIKTSLLDQFVRSQLMQTLQIHEIRSIAEWSGTPCSLHESPWDFYDINKFGLIYFSTDELQWLITNRKTLTANVTIISGKDYNKFLAERRDAQEREVAETARRDAERVAQRKENAKLIEQGDSSGWLAKESRLFFIATGSNENEICYIAESPKVAEQRRILISGFFTDKSMIEREPILGNSGGQGTKLDSSEDVFQHIQQKGCSLVMGTANELKRLLVEGLPSIGRQNAAVLSVVLDKSEVERLVDFATKAEASKKHAEQQAEETAKQAQQKEEEEREAAIGLRAKDGIVAVTITCIIPNRAQLPLIHCLGNDGSIRITDHGNTTEFKQYTLGGAMVFTRDLSPPWNVTAQNGGDDLLTLNAVVTDARGHQVRDQASGYHVIRMGP
jgi:TPR repeat protein/uncharacterized protein